MRHVVWDWNGTLFDDLDVVVEAVNVSIAAYGADPIDVADYGRLFRRPLERFYERLLGRSIEGALMSEIDERFQEAYRAGFEGAGLTLDAADAVNAVTRAGASQSVASMLWHDMLVPTVKKFGLDEPMLALDGHRGAVGETKADHLTRHVNRLAELFPGLDRERMTVIGDIVDDAHAARAAGIACVLYDGGSQPREALEAEGFPVASTLVEAVGLAITP